MFYMILLGGLLLILVLEYYDMVYWCYLPAEVDLGIMMLESISYAVVYF